MVRWGGKPFTHLAQDDKRSKPAALIYIFLGPTDSSVSLNWDTQSTFSFAYGTHGDMDRLDPNQSLWHVGRDM